MSTVIVKPKKFYGWWMVVVLWLIYGLGQGLVLYGGPVLNTYAMQDLGFSRTLLGSLGMVFSLVMAAVTPLVSKLINAKGIRMTTIVGAVIILIGSLFAWLLVKTTLGYILVYGIFLGAGLAFCGMLSTQTGITLWFRERRGIAMSLCLSANGVGSFIGSFVFKACVHNGEFPAGWHTGYMVMAFCSIVIIILAALFVINRPEDAGQIPDGKIFDVEAGKKAYSKIYKYRHNLSLKAVMRDYRFWFMCVALMAIRFSYYFMLGHGVAHLLDNGVNAAVAATALGSMALMGAITRVVISFVQDKIEPQIVWLVGLIIYTAGFICLWTADSTFLTYCFAAGMGIGFSLDFVASTLIISNYYGAESFTTIQGLLFPLQLVVGAVAPTIGGLLFDLSGSYNVAFIIGTVLLILGIIGVAFCTKPKRGENEPPAPGDEWIAPVDKKAAKEA